jgi:lipopolysaccharide transport system ATP-binding protein
MTDLAISAQGLGKRYRLGRATRRHTSLGDLLVQTAKAPFENFRRVRRMRTFEEAEGDDVLWAVRDVSFDIRHGEVVGFIGRNGAGKSTLLKLLSRITEPSTGRAVIRGRVGSLLEVGTGFHPDLTGRENVYLNGAILGMDREYVRRRFDEIVEFAGVERFIDTPVRHYSSGMYLRLAFAVAAHLEPEILIVDEVLAVGDAAFQKKCIGKMSSVSQEGRTVLFVSHNLTAVRSLCSRVILLRGGTVVADEPPELAVSSYIAEMKDSTFIREYERGPDAPQNEAFVVRAVSVRDTDRELLTELYTTSEFDIEIEYETKHDAAFVGLGVFFYDLENNCLFSSYGNREPNWFGRPMPKGRYRTSCRIPGNLLNDRWVTVSIYLYNESMWAPVWARDVLRFEVHDSGEMRQGYYHVWEGALRPILDWRTERETEARPARATAPHAVAKVVGHG